MMMNTKQRGGGCCSKMSVMTVVMNKRVTGVSCGAENSLCHEEREASKHEIREEAVMQLSAPTALGGEGGAPRHVTGQKTPKQGLPHLPTPPSHLFTQSCNYTTLLMNHLSPMSPPPSPLLRLLITRFTLLLFLHTCIFCLVFRFITTLLHQIR